MGGNPSAFLRRKYSLNAFCDLTAQRVIRWMTRLRWRFPRFDILLGPSYFPDCRVDGSSPAKAITLLYDLKSAGSPSSARKVDPVILFTPSMDLMISSSSTLIALHASINASVILAHFSSRYRIVVTFSETINSLAIPAEPTDRFAAAISSSTVIWTLLRLSSCLLYTSDAADEEDSV